MVYEQVVNSVFNNALGYTDNQPNYLRIIIQRISNQNPDNMKPHHLTLFALSMLTLSSGVMAQTKSVDKKASSPKSAQKSKEEKPAVTPQASQQAKEKEPALAEVKSGKANTHVKIVTIKDGKTVTMDTTFNQSVDDQVIDEIVERYTGKGDSSHVRTFVYKDGPRVKRKIRINRSLDQARKSLKDLDMRIEGLADDGFKELEKEIDINIPDILEGIGEEIEGAFEHDDEDVVIIRPDAPRGPKHLRIRPLAPRTPRYHGNGSEEDSGEPRVFKFYHREGEPAPEIRGFGDAHTFNFNRRGPAKRRSLVLLDTVVKGEIVKLPNKADLKNALANAEITVEPSTRSGQFSIEVVSASSEPVKVIVATKTGTELVNKTVYKEAGKFSSTLNVGKTREDEFLIQLQQGKETVTKKIRFGGR